MADVRTPPAGPLAIGAFPLPFGFLLLPQGDAEVEEIRDGLVAGRLPAVWPQSLRSHELALAGDVDAALAELRGSDPVTRFNRFVLDPDSIDAQALQAELGPELGVLVEIVSFVLGRTDVAPDLAESSGELAALSRAAHAVLALDAENPAEAELLLNDAVAAARPVSAALAGVLHGAAAQAAKQAGGAERAIEHLIAGIALLDSTDLKIGCAEQHLELAATYQERAGDHRDLLARAVHHYHCALQIIGQEDAPELFAAAHANLATAYLTMPMVEASDQLRLGVAVGSLRSALEVYKPETHPHQWSSAQLNLANALVYAPSTHQADNLVEAVELYEAVLNARSRESDPLGYARVLANQGNALAHLGMFEHARGKLVESRFIFEEFHEYESVTSVRGILDEMARQVVLAGSDV